MPKKMMKIWIWKMDRPYEVLPSIITDEYIEGYFSIGDYTSLAGGCFPWKDIQKIEIPSNA